MVAVQHADVFIRSKDGYFNGTACLSGSSSAELVGVAVETTRDRVTRAVGKPGEHLDSDIARADPCICEIRFGFSGRESIRRKVERIHDIRTEQIRVADGESLSHPIFPKLDRIQSVMDH